MVLDVEKSIVVNYIPVSRSIFRDYDIRGVADIDPQEPENKRSIDLTARQAWLIGKAYGTWVRRRAGTRIALGRDTRRTSVDLATGFATGVLSTGVEVIDIGLTTTPMSYFAILELECAGGAMITGSHNPMWSNGLKLSKTDSQTLVGDEIASLYDLIQKQDFEIGHGYYREDSVVEAYIDTVKQRVKPAGRALKVVVDPGNASGGLFAPRLLSELGYDVVPIHSEIIYPFPNGSPDPEQPDKVIELGRKVRELNADIGIAYDGDADRVGVVDENGNKMDSDLLVLFLARAILKEHPGAEIIFDIKCSDFLIEDIQQRGGIPVMWKTGHSNIKQKLASDYAAGLPAYLGGELSGHIFFKDRFFGFDDAVYASARVLEILSYSESSVSSMMADVPKLYTTRELALPCPDDKKEQLIAETRTRFVREGYQVIEIDGVRIQLATGKWGLVRSSNTQPKLTARIQAPDQGGLVEIATLLNRELSRYDFVELSDLRAGVEEAIRQSR